MVLVLVLFMAVLGGLVVVLSLSGVAVTLVALPWAIYVAVYLTIFSGLAVAAI